MAKFWETLAAVGLVEKVDDTSVETQTIVASPPVVQAPLAPVISIDLDKIKAIDESSRKILITAMQNDGAPLVEEISDTLETLQDAISDERARYVSAIKILVKRGHSVTAILSDFDKCLGVLETNKRSFEADSKSQFDVKVGAKIRNVESLTAQIEAKNKQLEALRQEIVALSVQRDAEQAGISGEQSKITQVQERFTLIYTAIRSGIETSRAKVSQHGEGL